MARKLLRVKMRNSLHGRSIAIPDNITQRQAASILIFQLAKRTPVDTGQARRGWNFARLSNGDVRATNKIVYIRRLMIDGHSEQQSPGVYREAIKAARERIIMRSKEKADGE